jgi:hypothetical protein
MFASEIMFYNLMMISGKKWSGSYLTVDSQGKVGAMSDDYEVLLRKRA